MTKGKYPCVKELTGSLADASSLVYDNLISTYPADAQLNSLPFDYLELVTDGKCYIVINNTQTFTLQGSGVKPIKLPAIHGFRLTNNSGYTINYTITLIQTGG